MVNNTINGIMVIINGYFNISKFYEYSSGIIYGYHMIIYG